uniref:Monocarboxylate transporter n=1 Tax=Anopheles stephensi TaxID=30069 RepID=A0A182YF00_ANOST
MSSLIRALSWPLISQSQGGGGPGGPGGPGSPIDGLDGLGNGAGHCKKAGGIPPSPTFQQLMAARRLLCRRYYPEGGWGWVVIVVGVLVHTMTHGLQLSYGPLMASVMRYFGKPFTDTGKAPLLHFHLTGVRRAGGGAIYSPSVMRLDRSSSPKRGLKCISHKHSPKVYPINRFLMDGNR